MIYGCSTRGGGVSRCGARDVVRRKRDWAFKKTACGNASRTSSFSTLSAAALVTRPSSSTRRTSASPPTGSAIAQCAALSPVERRDAEAKCQARHALPRRGAAPVGRRGAAPRLARGCPMSRKQLADPNGAVPLRGIPGRRSRTFARAIDARVSLVRATTAPFRGLAAMSDGSGTCPEAQTRLNAYFESERSRVESHFGTVEESMRALSPYRQKRCARRPLKIRSEPRGRLAAKIPAARRSSASAVRIRRGRSWL